jgi:glycosyltransferase involved in cell wall biosynthesis
MAEEFDLHVYYFSDASIKGNLDKGFNQNVKWDIPLLEGYSYTFLKNISGRKSMSNRFWDVVNPSVIQVLYKNKNDIVIVNGWSYFSNLLTIVVAKILRKKVWLRAENPLNQELLKSPKMLFIKKIVLRYFLFLFIDKFLYIGHESKEFFKFYGAKDSRLLFTPYAVDNDLFIKIKKENISNIPFIKRELGLPAQKKIILFTGKYIEKKRPLDLIKAFHLLNDSSAVLVMVGEGDLRHEMEAYIAGHHIENILLTGFINQSVIVKYYAVSDMFVMCSGVGETWGLSVNEAMCFSLPVVVSATCGCATELVQRGVNGFTFQEGDITMLSAYLKELLNDEMLSKKFGRASLKIVEKYSNKSIIKNMKVALG